MSRSENVARRIASSDAVELDLSNLGLTEVPQAIFDSKFASVEKINFGGNKLNSLPSEFARLRKLKTLFFANNDFDSVPVVLGKLPELFMLSFKGT